MKERNDIQIPVTIGGVTFKNPFFVASGPTTKTVKQLVRIEETGWAAASIKLSIDPAPYINRKPRYSLFKDRDALAFTTEKRLTFQQGLQLIREAKPQLHDLLLMANITYAGDAGVAGWVNMAKKFEEAGADIIELNMCCPNMSYNVETTSGGAKTGAKQTGASMGQHADVASEIVRAIKKELHIPLFVKLTPEGGQIAHVAKALYEAGADAVGGTGNRLGMPPIDLDDPGKAFFHLQEEISMGCYCSGWLKPLAQRDTYEIRKVCGMDAPIMAAGGIRNWQDAVEMVLCGGNLLGVCAETLISGYDIVRPMIEGLHNYMTQHGYTSLDQMRGLVVPQVRTATDVTLHGGYARIKDPNLSAPCKSSCPHHIPVQAYVQKVAKGEFKEAYDLITSAAPLQSLCALVCTHPCEDACIRGGFDSPVKIRALKRFVLDYGRRRGWKPAWAPAQENGRKIAVVGAGAAGLSCAAQLRKAGYAVTVFEKEQEAGGALRYALPDYAGQKAVLEEEISRMQAEGIAFEFGTEVKNADELKARGFELAVSCLGNSKQVPCGVEGGDALEFLYEVNTGKNPAVEASVAVVGGGFAVLDAARCARRLGAEKVTVLLPGEAGRLGWNRETTALCREEGIRFLDLVSDVRADANGLAFDRDGCEMHLACAQVLVANDYEPALLPGSEGFVVYAQVRGSNVIAAMTAGKNAAAAADRLLRAEAATLEPVKAVKTVSAEKVRQRTGYLKKDVNPLALVKPAEERLTGFEEYTRVMTEEEAVREASRCLNCGCGEGCQLCKTICTDFAPFVAAPDTMGICKEECVACGMCFNRCPNGNIEMVDLGQID